MKEHKYRAWYDKSQTWVYFNIGQSFTELASKVYSELCVNGSRFYEFTGLTDKNVKDIYTGDKLRTKYGNIIEVKDLEYIYLWRYENHNAWSSIEVIGNIHQSKELINN